MKLIAILVFSFSVAFAFGQNYSIETDDTTFYGTAAMGDFSGDVDLDNILGSSFQMVWQVDTAELPVGWDFSMCDQSTCHPIGTTADLWWLPGGGGYLNIHFYPNSIDGEGYVRIHVYDYNNPADEAWITFRGTTLSNSVAELNQSNISVYPNPVVNRINVSGLPSNGQLYVKDVLGKTIMSSAINSTNKELDLSELRNGAYLLVISNGESQVTKKFIKRN